MKQNQSNLISGGIFADNLAGFQIVIHSRGKMNRKYLVSTMRILCVIGILVSALGISPAVLGSSVSAASGNWVITGSMNIAGPIHTATLLTDGKVLVAGGKNGISALARAELYDPTTGTWTATGSMNVARAGHMAVLLPDGKVLVVGGEDSSTNSGKVSAELYDPSTGTWVFTGSMNVGRYSQVAILLPDGKVLVTGGWDPLTQTAIGSAELYDPETGTWDFTGSMINARSINHATLLPNGQVLVAGGMDDDSPYHDLPSAERYDPESGLWTYTVPMNSDHGASNPPVLLSDGKVLVTGASNNPGCELYDPAADSWTTTGSMNVVRRGHFAVLLPDGKVLAAGGSIFGGSGATTLAEVYDPDTGTWTGTNPMNFGHYSPNATRLTNGNLLITGGDNSFGRAELYDIPPTVTVEQAAGQSDPASTGPIEFTAAFSEPVTGFDGSDVSFTGSTATGTLSATITGTGHAYTISVTGMTGSGAVVVSIPADAVTDSIGNTNVASTSLDNLVIFTLCYNLTTAVTGSGSVSANPAPNCGTQYTSGTTVQLTANPASGFTFSSWSGDASGTANPVDITMNGDRSVTANFTRDPTLNVTKTETSIGPYTLGDTINFSIVVENTWNQTLNNVTVADPSAALGTCTPPQPAVLDAGATMICPATHVVAQVDIDAGSYVNTATADSSQTEPDTSTATVTFIQAPPGIMLDKRASPLLYDSVGDEITYSYNIYNIGNTTLSGAFSVFDDHVTVTCPPSSSVAPSAMVTCTASHTITEPDLTAGSITNNATASVQIGFNTVVSQEDSETVTAVPVSAITALNPAIVMAGGGGTTLTVDGTGFLNGAQVQWNGSPRTTTFVDSTRLTAAISAADLAAVGIGQVAVLNFAEGSPSNPVNVNIYTFADSTPTDWHWRWVEGLYARQITGGCDINPFRYCPERQVTRAEMSVFILRAVHGAGYTPPAATGIFADVPVAGKEWMQPWVEQFYREGITGGCDLNPLRYCPERQVTRAEMATFIDRAFGFPQLP